MWMENQVNIDDSMKKTLIRAYGSWLFSTLFTQRVNKQIEDGCRGS
jgi:hypothetical protein